MAIRAERGLELPFPDGLDGTLIQSEAGSLQYGDLPYLTIGVYDDLENDGSLEFRSPRFV